MESTNPVVPKRPPPLQIPQSSSTVDVRVIDTNTLLYLNPELFWQPKISGFSGLDAPIYCFLISHGEQHILFDLGVRPDWQNYAPKLRALIQATTTITSGSDVASVLDAGTTGLNIRSSDIQAVIWSHNHFDHVGDITTFPSSTELIVGPGVCAASWPGWPSSPDATVLDADAQGRVVRELSFEHGDRTAPKIGRFDALDFFEDGSFYLLDAPGHANGHLCALARTTDDPPSFIFMGADACHHPGVLRPSDYLLLPKSLTLGANTCNTRGSITDEGGDNNRNMDDAALLQDLTMSRGPTAPFFQVAQNALFPNHDAAMDTVRKIQALDASKSVFVVMAHDLSLRDQIPLFPEKINSWRAAGEDKMAVLSRL